ncbi:hypothetical protein [Bosea sp. (in: a-proteobacteria)]|uniref:hypothetical protein n=1 Tax=Bosea sp. (in: a-proteobacteria) TaxID=1871050 RepID=UPI0012024FBA|nr:hypothetical protein [Bosea sp. (in: a-proteobacteria)]TAJ29535.1 MAG: hypothetical protein EPO59_14895 [Bosea sp. (in: a-proteobacteria)]
MKYSDPTHVKDRADHLLRLPAAGVNIIALRRSNGDHPWHGWGFSPRCDAPTPPVMSPECIGTRTPVSGVSWIERLVIDFGIAGNAPAFGSAFGPCPTRPVPAQAKTARPLRPTLARRLGAAVASAWHRIGRELAIRRALQDLRRLDAPMLRDIGIFDADAIELFVRNGGER